MRNYIFVTLCFCAQKTGGTKSRRWWIVVLSLPRSPRQRRRIYYAVFFLQWFLALEADMSLYPKLTESALALSSDDESEGWRENNSPQRPNLYDGRGSSPVRHVSRAGHEKTTSPSPRRSTVSLVEFERQYSRRSLSSVRGNVREKFDATDGKSRFFSWQKVKDYLYYNGRTNMFIFIPVVGCVLGVLAATILGALQLGKTPPRGALTVLQRPAPIAGVHASQ